MKNLLLIFIALLFAAGALAQSVGINSDGSVPNSSAMLDVSSTSKGFLPPRMTNAQKIVISAPAAGLIIWCTDCGTGELQVYNGTAWTNIVGSTASPVLAIGDTYGGGKIAYILQSGDPGYDANTVHGLIAAPSNQSTGIIWYNGIDYTTTGATATAIGTGNANTNTIVSNQGEGSYAAILCADLVLGGYSDWYLPSKDELNKLYLNQVAIGGFTDSPCYWSSSEDNSNNHYAWEHCFTNNSRSYNWKNNTISVRAVRAF